MKPPPPSLPPRVQLMRLQERRSKTGTRYLAGFLGAARVVVLRDPAFELDLEKPDVLDGWIVWLEQAPERPRAASSPGPRGKP